MFGLTTLRGKLNGSAADPPTLAAQLAEIQSAIDALPGRQAELAERRLVALRRDDDTEAREIEAQQADLARDRDRLADSKRNIGEQLRDATAAARQRRLLSHRDAWSVAAAEFLASARVTVAKHAAVVAVSEQARREGFEVEATRVMPPTPNVGGHALCAPPLLDMYALAVAGKSSATRDPRTSRRPAASPSKVAKPLPSGVPPVSRPRLPHERQQATNSQRGATLSPDAGHARPTPRPRPPDDLTALQPGEARVKVLRAGFSPRNDLAQCAFGQIIKMPRSAAERVEGVVQILERYEDIVTATAPAADAGAAEPAPSAATPDELRA